MRTIYKVWYIYSLHSIKSISQLTLSQSNALFMEGGVISKPSAMLSKKPGILNKTSSSKNIALDSSSLLLIISILSPAKTLIYWLLHSTKQGLVTTLKLLTKEEEVAVFANAFAASLISSSEVDFETGRRETESGKLYIAEVS